MMIRLVGFDTFGRRSNFLMAVLFFVLLRSQLTAAVASQDTSDETASGSGASQIVVSYADDEGTLQLYVVNQDGSSRRQLTDGKQPSMQPAWSPDGEKVVYVRQSGKGLAIWLTDPEGGRGKALTEPGGNLLPSWLPDSKHIVWMRTKGEEEPSRNSQLWIMNTLNGESRRLFSDPDQMEFSNSMPVVSPQGDKVAFVSNRGGRYRIWVSNLDGSKAREISRTPTEEDENIQAPIEQKVPAWSPDGKWLAHWEGVEMIHLSRFTGRHDPERDQQITETWHVWVVGVDGKNKRRVGKGDDPTWSPNGHVTRSFPDPKRGGPKIMVESRKGWVELPIVPPRRQYGRFAWKP